MATTTFQRKPRAQPRRAVDPNLARFRRVLRRRLPKLRETYGVRSLWLFGSRVRGEARKRSDLDVLVEFDDLSRLSLFEFIGLENQLSDWLGVRVDLVEKGGLKPAIGQNVMREAVPV
jgi:predicted nucleotidyltransferase